jgi:hypothetical protein
MKRYNLLVMLALVLISVPIMAQNSNTASQADSTGMPGDNFSLQGALEMFKKAPSLEAFEKELNSEDNKVNNLDLDGDGKTDYVKVIDNMDKDIHAVVLQVVVNETESQDVAVIEIEKNGNESAQLQITGDEDLYPKNTIVEPIDEKTEPSSKNVRKGPDVEMNTVGIFFNVWYWPCIRFMYAPAYVVWVSPWRWNHYPGWWRPWHPHPWRTYHSYWAPYHVHYNVVHTHRVVAAHTFYGPRRTSSVVVRTRNVNIHETTVNKRVNVNTRNNRAVERGNRKMEKQNQRSEKMGGNEPKESKREANRANKAGHQKHAKGNKGRR